MSHNEYQDPETVKRTIQELLNASRKGCSPRQLLKNYILHTGREIPHESFGYSTLMAYLNSMPSLVTVTRRRDGTLLTVPQGSLENSELHSTELHQLAASTSDLKMAEVKPGLKKQLANLMLSYPNGIRLVDLQEAFARRFSFYFSHQECGFSTLVELINSIPNVLKIEFEGGSKGVTVYAACDDVVQSSGINWEKLTKDRKNSEESMRTKRTYVCTVCVCLNQ